MSPIRHNAWTFPRLLKALLVTALILAGSLYVSFQARLLITGPQVTLTDEPEIVQSDRQVILSGVAKNITEIYLNGRPISTDEAGVFKESIVLENGHSTVRIDAEDRYGRHTSVERSFVYQPQIIHYQ